MGKILLYLLILLATHLLTATAQSGASSGSGQIPTLTPEDDTTTDPQSGLIDTFEQLINRILSATGIPRTAFYAICAVCGVALLSIILLFIAASIAVAKDRCCSKNKVHRVKIRPAPTNRVLW